MKIAYIPQNDPYNKNSWSGTDFYVRKSLEAQGVEVYCIYGFKSKPTISGILHKVIAKLFGKQYWADRSVAYSRKWASFIKKRLQPGTEAILSLGTIQVAELCTDIPIFIYVDGVFEQMRVDYKWDKLDNGCIRKANALEQNAIENCTRFISCSIETAEATKKFYRVADGKVEVVPLGANFDIYPDLKDVAKYVEKRIEKDVCSLLFVGVDWKRKGADIVVDTVKELAEKGFPVELHLVGIRNVPVNLPSNVINHGFVNKNVTEGMNLLNDLFRQSHFLFVPSRAEAYGLVFCEASAYGLPSISHRLGGIYTIVEDDVNGRLFSPSAEPRDFANYIERMFADKDKYKKLCFSSYRRFCESLNWDVAGKKLVSIISK